MDVEGKVKVLVATTEPLLADGIASAIMVADNLEVVAKPKDRTELITLAPKLQPHVLIVDFALLEPDIFQAVREIKLSCPVMAILALVSKRSPPCLLLALRAGIAGYLPKKASRTEIVNAVRGVCSGEAVLDLESVRELIQSLGHVMESQGHLREMEGLTQKELEVLKLASKSLTNKKIAQKLCISERTVQSHFGTIFNKLGAASRTEAVLQAWRNGWITGEDLLD